jgi:hypothetical protein
MVNITPKHFVASVRPLLPQTAPVPISERDVAKTPPRALPPRFARGDDFTAPPKFGLSTSVSLVFSLSSSSAPQGGGMRPANHFVATQRPLLPQTGAPATPTIDSWLATLGPNAQPQKFATSASNAPDKVLPSSTTFLFAPSSPAQQGGGSATPRHFSAFAIKPLLPQTATPAPPVFSWRGEDPYVPKFDWYAMGDTSTGPSATASAAMSYVSAIEGQNAQPQRFAGVTYSAPDKFGLTAPPTPTIAGWLATLGPQAQPQRFDRGAANAPEKVLPFIPAIPTLGSWTPSIGVQAQPQDYDRGGVTGPDKANLTVPSVVFLPGWQDTDGAQAVKFTFTQPPPFAGPDKVLPFFVAPPTISSWTTTDGQKAVPQLATPGDTFSAPGKSITSPGPYVLITALGHKTYSAFISIDGFEIVGTE